MAELGPEYKHISIILVLLKLSVMIEAMLCCLWMGVLLLTCWWHVYFHHSVLLQVKFADFCGKYRIPFLHYLCSPGCHDSVPGHSSAYSGQSSSQSDDTGDELEDVERRKMKRVLLSDP